MKRINIYLGPANCHQIQQNVLWRGSKHDVEVYFLFIVVRFYALARLDWMSLYVTRRHRAGLKRVSFRGTVRVLATSRYWPWILSSESCAVEIGDFASDHRLLDVVPRSMDAWIEFPQINWWVKQFEQTCEMKCDFCRLVSVFFASVIVLSDVHAGECFKGNVQITDIHFVDAKLSSTPKVLKNSGLMLCSLCE